MSEDLKKYAPDIKALGSGKALAVMAEAPNGVWCHIQDVRDLLDVKDRTIRDYEDNYLPRPKTTELKSWMIGSPETGEQWVYDAEEVDRIIAAKAKEIASLKKRLVEAEECAENACAERDDNQTAIDELTAENADLKKQLEKVRAIVK